MKEERTFKDIAKVVISNIISLFSAIFVAFILPKITSLIEFGYYKTFTLYVSYVGLLHFGFCDGVYLEYGGKVLSELNNRNFRFYCFFIHVMELVISIFIALFATFFTSEDVRFLFYALAIYSFFHISASFYNLVLQATSQFHVTSLRVIIYSLLRVFGIGMFWLYSIRYTTLISFRFLIIFMILLEFILAVWLLSSFRKVLFGNTYSIRQGIPEIPHIFRLGTPLLITNLSSTFLFVLDRQFVNIFFPKDEYAIYAFAYSLLTLATTTTSAISTVMFPKLKRTSVDNLKNNYSKFIAAILAIVFACLTVYFPLCVFIKWYLPKYTQSLVIFRIIFPGLAISSTITVVMYNYYKVLNIIPKFLKISLFIILFSVVTNYLAYINFRTTWSISVASIFTMMLWYVMVEKYFITRYSIRWEKNIAYLFVMMTAFYIVTFIKNEFLGFLVYLSVFILLTYIFYRSEVASLKYSR